MNLLKPIIILIIILIGVNQKANSQISSKLKEYVVLTYELSKRKNPVINQGRGYEVKTPQLVHTEYIPGVGDIAILLEGWSKNTAKCYLVCDNDCRGAITQFYIKNVEGDVKSWDIDIFVYVDFTADGSCTGDMDFDSCKKVEKSKSDNFKITSGKRLDIAFKYKKPNKDFNEDDPDKSNDNKICRVIAL